jgi:hypothetical protein
LKTRKKIGIFKIISLIIREIITPEEGFFLCCQELKGIFLTIKGKEYSIDKF